MSRCPSARSIGSLSVALFLSSSFLFAQTPQPTPTPTPQDKPKEEQKAPADQQQKVLDEIVVTAQKRAESAQDVPIALSVTTLL